MHKENVMRPIAIFGAIVAIIEAVLDLFGLAIWMLWGFGWIGTIIIIIAAVVIIIAAIFPDTLPFNGVYLLIVTIVIMICGAWIGGLILILAAVIGLFLQ